MTKLPRYALVLFAIMAITSLMVLYFYHPLEYAFYPNCLFFKLTGYKCPLCGGLRAAHELTHGNFLSAWHYNAMLVMSIPFIIGKALIEMPWFSTKKNLLTRLLSILSVKVLSVIVLLWWVFRNIWGI